MSEIDIRMTRTRSQLVMDHPFYGCLAMRLEIVEDNSIDTMETDGSKIWYSRKFLEELTDSERMGVYVHEVQHCILGHTTRRGDRDPELWNRACDYAINPMVLDAGFKLPDWVLIDRAKFAGLNAEEIYTKLLQEQEQQQQQQPQPQPSPDGDDGEDQDSAGDGADDDAEQQPGSGGGDDKADDEPDGEGDESSDRGGNPQDGDGDADQGDGDGNPQGGGDEQGDDKGAGKGGPDQGSPGQDSSGEGGDTAGDGVDPSSGSSHVPDPGRCGGVRDAAPAHDKAQLSEKEGEWEVAVRQAVNIGMKAGSAPGNIAEIIKHLGEPRIDWRDTLDRFVDFANSKDYSTSNPMRRMLPFGYVLPGVVSDGVSHLVIAIDSSISINTRLLEIFGAEVQGLLNGRRVDKVTVIFCDVRVTKHDEYEPGDVIDWTVPGRGGTAFSPAFAWVAEHAPDAKGVIYFTDMECWDYGPEPDYPVLWAGYGEPQALKRYMAAAPFGEPMDINAALYH